MKELPYELGTEQNNNNDRFGKTTKTRRNQKHECAIDQEGAEESLKRERKFMENNDKMELEYKSGMKSLHVIFALFIFFIQNGDPTGFL